MSRAWRELAVLVVDEVRPIREVIANQLRSLGIDHVAMTEDGAEALRLLKRQPFDVVICDWNAPIRSGLDLLAKIRANQPLQTLPFIMVTAELDRGRIEKAISAGVSDLLVKPFTVDRLESALQTALASRGKHHGKTGQAGNSEAVMSVVKPATDTTSEVDDRLTILVVDDSPSIVKVFHQLFSQDYRVRFAGNGAKAVMICQTDSPPDLVLLDVMMPDMDGFEVATAMRQHPQSAHIPVIFVTAMDSAEASLKGRELGAVDYISKPVMPEQLLLRVKNFMEYVRLRKLVQGNYDTLLETYRLRETMEDIVHHDMKGPLLTMVGLLRDVVAADNLSWRQIEQVSSIEQTAWHLLDTVNLSSELYKIEAGRFNLAPQPVSVGAILRRMVEGARVTFHSKHLTITVETDMPMGMPAPQVSGDPTLCYSVFNNLLNNACEAASENSQVSVIVRAAETSVEITITNSGVVAPEIRDRFFEKYVTSGKPQGTGLGTYSARLLTEAQNGSISFEVSNACNTTTLRVALPLWMDDLAGQIGQPADKSVVCPAAVARSAIVLAGQTASLLS
ncbi:hypothetical protein HNQ50_000296 [Silvimonas terrae]|uniref:Uncharacterized protein n=1 Tax=Silvimonas terrae TaxID=300266 RepID=A0A840RAV7_9NEIS|nr:hybrid sensor histidine kinase/response regulator [Silvimonas terrae]MBB5189586.1 hypothetical protein [Silvimonas terrae]